MHELICMLETITYDKKSPSHLESQNLEARLVESTEVKVDQLVVENDETITDNEKYPLHIESQNLEVRLEENTVVKVDDLVEQNDETDVSSLAWYVQANFKRAVEESRDSHNELRKLNQLLVLEASSLVSSI
ncbi:hypothetical protein Tco_0814753, partial [Tanacetum coccineum]